ncbi:hypothetical protein F5Y19DRAFT_491043 [Xylariaceae sp. FL1651]|nr:hypothetical protein F5Y19DRAFT_491043 [Xylariaceae sp. FL1651]
MHFNNVLIALGSVACIAGMPQGVNVRSSIDVIAPRTLAPSFTKKTDQGFLLEENQWVLSNVVKRGDVVSVVDVTGCDAVFLWDENSIPSAFHIFCGDEAADGAAAVKMVEDEPAKVYIGAGTQAHYNALKAAIKASFPSLGDDKFVREIYSLNQLPSGKAYKFETVAGTTGVTMTTQTRVSKQPNRF